MAQSFGHNLFTVQEREVQVIDLDKGLKGVQVGSCKRASNAMTSGLKSLQFNAYNPSETNILVYYTQDGGCYDLFVGPNNITNDTSISPKQGNAQAVCFTARNRFAVLQPGGSIGIYNLQNELSKKFDMPISVDYIFPGWHLFISLEDVWREFFGGFFWSDGLIRDSICESCDEHVSTDACTQRGVLKGKIERWWKIHERFIVDVFE